jgi:hypothetical protein
MKDKAGTYRVWWFYHTPEGHFHGDRIVQAASREGARQMITDMLKEQGVDGPEICSTFVFPERGNDEHPIST